MQLQKCLTFTNFDLGYFSFANDVCKSLTIAIFKNLPLPSLLTALQPKSICLSAFLSLSLLVAFYHLPKSVIAECVWTFITRVSRSLTFTTIVDCLLTFTTNIDHILIYSNIKQFLTYSITSSCFLIFIITLGCFFIFHTSVSCLLTNIANFGCLLTFLIHVGSLVTRNVRFDT